MDMFASLTSCLARWSRRTIFSTTTKTSKFISKLKRKTRKPHKYTTESKMAPKPDSSRIRPVTVTTMASPGDCTNEIEWQIGYIAKIRSIQTAISHWTAGMRYQRCHMEGIIERCRIEFGLISTSDSSLEHELMSRGVWRLVHELGPWWDWPEFDEMFIEPAIDRDGRLLKDDMGRLVWRDRNPYGQYMEEEYLDLWARVANGKSLRTRPYGELVMPQLVQWNFRKLDQILTLRDGFWVLGPAFYEVLLLMGGAL